MNIADRIQLLRKSKGISQEELADKIGVSRQSVSKWESEQSCPDIEKIILMSEIFDVTTDYILKGIEPVADERENKPDAGIFALGATALNFIGIVVAITVWIERQIPSAVAAGLIFMGLGCLIHGIGQLVGMNKKKAWYIFGIINIWLLALIPISCVFNMADGIFGGHWIAIAPIPVLGNSLGAFGLCWLCYIVICFIFDIIMIKQIKKYKRG